MFCEPAVPNFYSCIITHSGSQFILTMCTIWIKSSEELFKSIALTITVSGTVQSTTECWESHLSTCLHSHLVPVNQGEKTVTKSLRFLFFLWVYYENCVHHLNIFVYLPWSVKRWQVQHLYDIYTGNSLLLIGGGTRHNQDRDMWSRPPLIDHSH